MAGSVSPVQLNDYVFLVLRARYRFEKLEFLGT
jgi:hypothetical protein